MKMNKKLTAALICTFSIVFVGCRSTEEDTTVKTVVDNEIKEVESDLEVETVSEILDEDENGIPKGLDMESTLPGEEWVKTFNGKLKKPVVVLYNDSTGRKEVITAGAEIKVEPNDCLAVFYPKGSDTVVAKYVDSSAAYSRQCYKIYELKDMVTNLYATVKVVGSEDWEVSFALIANENLPVLYPKDEIVMPEGVEVDSTLPGEQWLETFVENDVKEPVVVIFNDQTGRKEVVQPYADVKIYSQSDKLGIYIPEEGRFFPAGRAFLESEHFRRYDINTIDLDKVEEIRKMSHQDVELLLDFLGQDEAGNIIPDDVITIPFTLILE